MTRQRLEVANKRSDGNYGGSTPDPRPLEERTREREPLQWARTQNNLGNALATLGARENGTARLEAAVAAFRAALDEWARERLAVHTTPNSCRRPAPSLTN